MKKIQLAFILMLAFLGSQKIFAQSKTAETDTVFIQTSAICGDCEERLEHNISFEKGVTFVELNDSTKVLTVVYKTEKTDKEKLKIAVTKVGYDADDLAADAKAYEKLPACCKKENEPH